MDAEVVIWMLVFLGGYTLVLALLFRRAFARKQDGTGGPPPD